MLIFREARAGVATTMSGKSASSERCTASGTFWVRLIVRTSLAQYTEKVAMAFETCWASSRVGTKMRDEVKLLDGSIYARVKYCNSEECTLTYCLSAKYRLEDWYDISSSLA